MNKKIIFALLAVLCILTLTACGCKHETWLDADCVTPKTCADCGETEGAPRGHSPLAATCETARTCKVCGATDGDPLGHSWQDATCDAPKTCATCSLTEGEALGHSWMDATTETPKTCATCALTEGERIITDSRFTTAATQALHGKWVCNIDVDGDLMGIDDFEGALPISLILEFSNDGQFILSIAVVDEEGFTAAMKDYMMGIMYAEFASSGMSQEEADAAMKDIYGMTTEEYVDYALSEMDFNSLFADLTEYYVYYVEDNTLYSAEDWDTEMTPNTFTLNGDALTIESLGKEIGFDEENLIFSKFTD